MCCVMPTNFLRLDFLQEWMQNDVSVCHVIEGNIIAPSLKIRSVDGMFVLLFTVEYRVVSRSFVTNDGALYKSYCGTDNCGSHFILFCFKLTTLWKRLIPACCSFKHTRRLRDTLLFATCLQQCTCTQMSRRPFWQQSPEINIYFHVVVVIGHLDSWNY